MSTTPPVPAPRGPAKSKTTYPHQSTRPPSALTMCFARFVDRILRRLGVPIAPESDTASLEAQTRLDAIAQAAAIEDTAMVLRELQSLIDHCEESNAERWPTMKRTGAGLILLESMRPQLAEVAALVREGRARLVAGEPMPAAVGCQAAAHTLRHSCYEMLDQCERELAEERGP